MMMFGGGVDVEDLKRRSRFSNGQITFPGSVPAPEIAEWMRSAAASLASIRPDQGYDFAFPTKALASISCGVPVIYSGPGPLSQLIPTNRLGWATAWNAEDIASAMIEALEAPDVAPDQRLVDWVESNFSLRAMSERAADTISAVARTRSSPSASR
jgi:glycosyltransferase involved in cell wall biosynthesis